MNYPTLRIETINKDLPPTAQNVRVFLDDKDISGAVSGVELSIAVSDVTRATLHLYAHTEVDGLVLRTIEE